MIYGSACQSILEREQEIEALTRSIVAGLRAATDRERPPKVEALLNHIHRHLFDPGLNARQACQECGIRDHNVSTLFRRAVGRGIREYIEEQRIRVAQEVLSRTDAEVYLIAFAVGYSYQESFNRAFRRRTGCSPSRWRARRR